MSPEIVKPPGFNDLLQTISSKHFKELIFGPRMYGIPYHLDTNDLDRVLHLFAERLYRLGAANPLTIVLEFRRREEGWIGAPDIQRP